MKKLAIPMLIVKIIESNTMYGVQEDLHSFSYSAKVIFAILSSSIFSVHSSTSLSTCYFLHLQFLRSKYSPISYDLSQSHS